MKSILRILLPLVLALACSSKNESTVTTPAPAISSFTADFSTIAVGGTANLTGVFTHGAGTLDPGGLVLNSGVPLSVQPTVTTVYTLTVTGDDGVTAVNRTSSIAVVPAGQVITLAGTPGSSGSTDSSTGTAAFHGPSGIAVDAAGTLYVADTYNGTIRKLVPAGILTLQVSTLAGTAETTGHADGAGAAASFNQPNGLAVDSSGNIYVADTLNCTIRKITPDGVVSTLAGTPGTVGHADGTGAAASFFYPTGLAADAAGNIYVADCNNNAIRKVAPDGTVTTLAGTAGTRGSADGTGASASFNLPSSLVVDPSLNLFVTDSGNNTIRKVTATGEVTTVAGTAGITGSRDGPGPAASFHGPSGIALDAYGNLYVADTYNCLIRTINPAGVVVTIAGSAALAGSNDGTGLVATFYDPCGLATGPSGMLYVADFKNETIRRVTR